MSWRGSTQSRETSARPLPIGTVDVAGLSQSGFRAVGAIGSAKRDRRRDPATNHQERGRQRLARRFRPFLVALCTVALLSLFALWQSGGFR